MDMFAPPASHSAKFEQPGDTIAGEIKEISEPMQCTDFGTSNPSFWPSGDPMMQAKITLATDQRDPSDPQDDGKRGLWVVQSGKQGGLLWAIREAIKAAGAETIQVGGRLQVSFTGTDPESKNPHNPRKLYEAQYQPPAPGGGMFSQQGGGQGPRPLSTENQMNRPMPQQGQQAPQQGGYQQQGGAWGQATGQRPPAPQQQGGYQQQGQQAPQQSGYQQAPQQGGYQQAPQQGGYQQQGQQSSQQGGHQQAPQQSPQVDAQTETFIRSMVGQGIDTQTIVNSIALPAVTPQVVDSYR